MTVIRIDPGEVTSTGTQFHSKRGELEGMIQQARSLMNSLRGQFTGQRANTIFGEWEGMQPRLTAAVETLRILVPQNMSLLEGTGFGRGDNVSMGSEQYSAWQRQGLAAREQIAFRLDGLPQGSLLDASPISKAPREVVFGGLGVVLALVLVGGYALRRRSTPEPGEDDDAAFDEDVAEELDLLAELDARFAAGEIPQQEYEEERARVKATLMAQWRSAPEKFSGLEEETSNSQERKDRE